MKCGRGERVVVYPLSNLEEVKERRAEEKERTRNQKGGTRVKGRGETHDSGVEGGWVGVYPFYQAWEKSHKDGKLPAVLDPLERALYPPVK